MCCAWGSPIGWRGAMFVPILAAPAIAELKPPHFKNSAKRRFRHWRD